jgi:hypothetical protein
LTRSFLPSRALALGSAFLLALSVCAGAAASSVAFAAAVPSNDQPTVTTAAPAPDGSTLAATSEAAATAESASMGQMVDVTSDTTGEAMTWANPDGSFTTSQTDGPTRVADTTVASGWRTIDLTLVHNSDGTVGPKSPNEPIELSGAATATQVGTSGVVSIADGDGSPVKFGWNGALPDPVLSGATATYVGVEPNLNIVVQLTTWGFEQSFVLTGPPTASELKLVLPLSAPGLGSVGFFV